MNKSRRPGRSSQGEEGASERPDRWRLLWRDVRESIAGSQKDFTKGNIGRAILLLAIPMVLELVLESVFAVVDIFFVSRLGADAVATVGTTESMITIVYAVAIGLSMSVTAIVARRTGEKDPAGAAVAAAQAIWVGLIVSLPIMLLGFFAAPQLLSLMGMSRTVLDTHSSYTSIMLGSNVVIMMIFVINAIFRGAGDAAIAMRVLWVANSINIVLDPCLILGLGPFPALGIKGAAIATAIGRGSGVLFQLYHLSRAGGRICIMREQWRLQLAVMKQLLRLSMGGIGQFIIATSSWIGLVRIMNSFGSESVAGYTIAIRIVMFSILPSWGMSNAAATLVGQNLGASEPDRAEKSVWTTGWVNAIFLCAIGVWFYNYAEPLVRIFTTDRAVVEVGAQCLRYVSYGYPAYAYGLVMIQAFNGAGDTTTPTLMNFVCFWLVELPFAFFLAYEAGLNEIGVFISIIIAESLLGVAGILLFKRGRWKMRTV